MLQRISKILKIIIAILPLLLPYGLKAQNTQEIDSLLKVAEAATDSAKSEIYCNICWMLRNLSTAEAIEYAKTGLKYAEKTQNQKLIAHAMSYIGVCYRNMRDYESAFEIYNKGLETALNAGIKDEAAYAYINIGNIYVGHNDYHAADSTLRKALEIGREIKDSSIIAYTYLNLGRVNLGLKNNKVAKGYLETALEIREKRHEERDKIITVKKYLGDAAYADSIYDEALKFYMAALPSKNEQPAATDLLCDVYGRISNVYFIKNRYDSALYYGHKSLEISQRRGSNIRIKNASQYLGNVYLKTGDLQSAIKQYNITMSLADTFFNQSKSYGISNYENKLSKVKKEGELALLRQEQKTRLWITISMGAFLLIFFATIIILYRNNRNKKRINTILQNQNDEIEARNSQISSQRDMLQKQQKEITDSIAYAKRIQFAMIPERDILLNYFSDGFVFHVPRDVVSGDFWWSFHDADYFILICADCTGHGVPGAFMSMLGVSSLNEVVIRDGKRKADEIMNNLRDLIKKTVNRNANVGQIVQDGMDAALIVVDKNKNLLQYSGANIPFICYRQGEEIIIKPTHNPVGFYDVEVPFALHEFSIEKGDRIYLSSDGYHSQFGGPKKSLMKSSGYKKVLRSLQDADMTHQREIIEKTFFEWKGDEEQTDDILVIGMEV